jgi:hypothetical protein
MALRILSTDEHSGATRFQTESIAVEYLEYLQASDYEREPVEPKKKKRRGVKHRKSTKGK